MEDVALVCDAMLGGLARWLRFAGFDVLFDPEMDDGELADLARHEGRWLVTRDRDLASRSGPRVVRLLSPGLDGQVEELLRRLPLVASEDRFFSRCSRCNGRLRDLPRSEATHRVPPFVAVHADRFSVCTSCGRVYWPGTHHARILARLRRLFIEPR